VRFEGKSRVGSGNRRLEYLAQHISVIVLLTSSMAGAGNMSKPTIDAATTERLEAAAFRALVKHLRERTDVQNIDMMNLAGFCRNCLSRWYREAAEGMGVELADADAREIVYGMPYKEWQAKHQKQASDEAVQKFKSTSGH
jgi:hypothetical protein